MCAICWSGGQIIPVAGIAWRYWSVNRLKPSKADPERDADDADWPDAGWPDTTAGPADADEREAPAPAGVA